METTELSFPVFEANQVLSDGHLNDLFAYLDEQSRLTRADLIGIGIVCGLEVRFTAPGRIVVTRGCGVTSQGYLIVEPADVTLRAVREYRLPGEVGYKPFTVEKGGEVKQFSLWELFVDDDEPGAELLEDSDIPLQDMAVVLLLELKHDRARACGPESCDDRGGAMSTTVRRLLVNVADLDLLNDALKDRAPATFGGDLEARLALPDLRMPRFDVDNSSPVTAQSVLSAFHFALRRDGLVRRVADALSASYRAFRPLLVDEFAQNPFEQFGGSFGFLDSVPLTTGQVMFLQYYWDLFDDVVAAYDELRREGVRLVGACCPPDDLFPRHLTLGVLRPDRHGPTKYRHRFVPSPAVGDSVSRARVVQTLFRRLATMIRDFVEDAPDKGVRITPTRSAGPLSQKAIPYYYVPKGSPALCDVWDPLKTERGRGNRNLGYRSDEYSPAAPAYVTDPLRFDLEPNDFLRIEGHLGRNVQTVLAAMLAERKKKRLPFEVIALRAGGFDETIDVDLSKEDCRFEDLDTLYATLRETLRCFLLKQVKYFYEIPVPKDDDDDDDDTILITPTIGILSTNAPTFRIPRLTLGGRFEQAFTWKPGLRLPKIIAVPGAPDLPSQAMRLITALSGLEKMISADIRSLDFDVLRAGYAAIVQIAEEMEGARQSELIQAAALEARLDDIIFQCRLEPFEALEKEYRRRVKEVKQAQYLSHFLERHPGIQHKAGVPLGGTFILVYHEDPPAKDAAFVPLVNVPLGVLTNLPGGLTGMTPLNLIAEAAAPEPEDAVEPGEAFTPTNPILTTPIAPIGSVQNLKFDQLSAAMAGLFANAGLADDPDVRKVLGAWKGVGPVLGTGQPGTEPAVFAQAVRALADGSVIADFFLPYSCHSECTPIQYQLPPVRLRVNLRSSCTDAEGNAEVKLAVEGAVGAISVRIDGGAFEPSEGTLVLRVGQHTVTVRDATGNESSPAEIVIPPQLVIGATEVQRDGASFVVNATIEGGTPPYLVDPAIGVLVEGTFTSIPLGLAETLSLVVTDAAGCRVEKTVGSGEKPCDLPCGGEAVRQGHRFWLPEPKKFFPITEVAVTVEQFLVTVPQLDPAADPQVHDLRERVAERASHWTGPVSAGDFAAIARRWIREVAGVVADAVGSDQYLGFDYIAPPEGGGATGVLRIERLACVEYQIELVVTYIPGTGDNPDQKSIVLTYNSDGTGYIDRESGVQIWTRRFEVEGSNKCVADAPWFGECDGSDLKLDFTHERRDGTLDVDLKADITGDEPWSAVVWEVQDAVPPVIEGEEVTVTFRPVVRRVARLEPIERRVVLTLYTEKGCRVIVDRNIELTKPQG